MDPSARRAPLVVRADPSRLDAWIQQQFPDPRTRVGKEPGRLNTFGARELVLQHLYGVDTRQLKRLRQLMDEKKRAGSFEVDTSRVHALARALGESDVEKFLGVCVALDAVATGQQVVLPSAAADRGEIEVTAVGTNLLAEESFAPANRFVAVFVDRVKFRMRDRATGRATVNPGQYVRITVPSGKPGAVVMPVDRATGRVLVVTQYRHPQGRFLTELPRGFGHLVHDPETIDTARRELREETGAVPVDIDGVEQLFELKSGYTDTGKLAEAPGYFLAFVEARALDARARRGDPLMESPAWVPLEAFYEAVISPNPVHLEPGQVDFVLGDDRLTHFAPSALDHGELSIEDNFSMLTALLALPRLEAALGSRATWPKSGSERG